ncbi:agmatine deiminase family protein [Endozoicomonas elysicola]|nr:agmatine deiminase family protein [Endozoicomonas elysicola]
MSNCETTSFITPPAITIDVEPQQSSADQGYCSRFGHWIISKCPAKSSLAWGFAGLGLVSAGFGAGYTVGIHQAGNGVKESSSTPLADRTARTTPPLPVTHSIKTTEGLPPWIPPTTEAFIFDALSEDSEHVSQWATRKMHPWDNGVEVSTPTSDEQEMKVSAKTTTPEQELKVTTTTATHEKEVKASTTAATTEQPVEVSTSGNSELDPDADRARYLELLRQIYGESEQVPEIDQDTVQVEGRPWAEYEKNTRYLFFSDDTVSDEPTYEARGMKRKLARKLPNGVDLVVYTTADRTDHIRANYGPLVGDERLHVLHVPRGGKNLLWARDNLPIPVIGKTGELKLISGKNPFFQPDEALAHFLDAELVSQPHYDVIGGNFMADSKGNCVVVNNEDTQMIPDRIYSHYYGCNTTIRLEHIAGVGHTDEVVKFIDSNNVVTDQPAYQQRFEKLGYTVTLLPQPENEYETYVNSVIVRNTLFMPTFDQPTDEEAKQIYKKLGFKVVTSRSKKLSNELEGSFHCITSTFPKEGIMAKPSFNSSRHHG